MYNTTFVLESLQQVLTSSRRQFLGRMAVAAVCQ